MAKSPSHKFGQIIGDTLEAAVEPVLKKFAEENNLYLDKKGPRRPARNGLKVKWVDEFGNTHDLDFVLEKNGSSTKIGSPVAFIETAWRRYTKHSRNKAQEIQAAILPLVSTHHKAAPFIGAILAGVFTDGAINQLKSRNFKVLYFSYETIVEAFNQVGIDANFDEDTPDDEFSQKVYAWEALSETDKNKVATSLININSDEVDQFIGALGRAVKREIELIRLLPLHGSPTICASVQEAISFLEGYNENDGTKPIVKYEIEIRYNSGTVIRGEFPDKDEAIHFLRDYELPHIKPAESSSPEQLDFLPEAKSTPPKKKR